MTLSKLTWLDLQSRPRTYDAELDRFYHNVQLNFRRLSGEFAEDDRVITVKDLKTLGLIT